MKNCVVQNPILDSGKEKECTSFKYPDYEVKSIGFHCINKVEIEGVNKCMKCHNDKFSNAKGPFPAYRLDNFVPMLPPGLGQAPKWGELKKEAFGPLPHAEQIEIDKQKAENPVSIINLLIVILK